MYNRDVSSAVRPVSEQGVKITPLLRSWSTTTIIESKPSEGGRSVMKSILTCCKVHAKGTTENELNCGKVGRWYLRSTMDHVGTGGDRRAWLQYGCCAPMDCQCPILGRQDLVVQKLPRLLDRVLGRLLG